MIILKRKIHKPWSANMHMITQKSLLRLFVYRLGNSYIYVVFVFFSCHVVFKVLYRFWHVFSFIHIILTYSCIRVVLKLLFVLYNIFYYVLIIFSYYIQFMFLSLLEFYLFISLVFILFLMEAFCLFRRKSKEENYWIGQLQF